MPRGGSRPGAGRPRKPSAPVEPLRTFNDPLAFLLAVVRDEIQPTPRRMRAAIALLPYCHAKPGEVGKKALADEAAKTAGVGTHWGDLLTPRPPPLSSQ